MSDACTVSGALGRFLPHFRRTGGSFFISLQPLGKALKDLISIVTYETFRRWLWRRHPASPRPSRPRGRPRTRKQILELVLRMAQENKTWGYGRILAELRKLGIFSLSKSSVKNILRENGIDRAFERKENWFQYVKRHYQTVLACDFFDTKVWTWSGPRTFFVLFFINLHTREIQISGFTRRPTAAWTIKKIKRLNIQPGAPALLIRDRDRKFTREFDDHFERMGFQVFKTPYRSPNMNAFAESWVGRIKQECLNLFVILGSRHLRYLIEAFVAYYNQERPHSGLSGRPPNTRNPSSRSNGSGEIIGHPRLGGLTHHYEWA